MLKLGYASLDDVPESVRSLCTASEDGVVSLDETQLKTTEDVSKVLNAKRMEVEAHNATKARLGAWEKLGKSVEDIQSILDEYPTLKEGTKTNEDFLAEKRNHATTIRERDELKSLLAKKDEAIHELECYKTKTLRDSKWKEIRERLSKKFDASKLDMLFEDIEDNLKIDSIGEFQQYKGKPVEEYFAKRAELMGWGLKNTPGGSNPGADKIPSTKASADNSGGFLDEEELSLLDK